MDEPLHRHPPQVGLADPLRPHRGLSRVSGTLRSAGSQRTHGAARPVPIYLGLSRSRNSAGADQDRKHQDKSQESRGFGLRLAESRLPRVQLQKGSAFGQRQLPGLHVPAKRASLTEGDKLQRLINYPFSRELN